jgi:hypothetical protein
MGKTLFMRSLAFVLVLGASACSVEPTDGSESDSDPGDSKGDQSLAKYYFECSTSCKCWNGDCHSNDCTVKYTLYYDECTSSEPRAKSFAGVRCVASCRQTGYINGSANPNATTTECQRNDEEEKYRQCNP